MQAVNYLIAEVKDWPVLCTAVALVVIILLFVGAYSALDSWFLPRLSGMGKIIKKEYTPPEQHMVLMPMGVNPTIMIPMNINEEEKWWVTLHVGRCVTSVQVSEEYINQRRVDAEVPVEYTIGRFSGDLYIKSVG